MNRTAAAALAAVAGAAVAACTLIESERGLAGPPASDAALPADTPMGTQTLDASMATLSPDASTGTPPPEAGSSSRPPPAPGDAGAEASADAGVVLFARQSSPAGITVFEGDVCWVAGMNPTSIFCAPSSGNEQAREILSSDEEPLLDQAFDVALDAKYIYWSNGSHNQVVRKELPDGGASQYFTGDGHVSYLALIGANVWATDFRPGVLDAGSVVVGPYDGGPTSWLAYSGTWGAAGVAVYDQRVYWGSLLGDLLSGPFAGNVQPSAIPSPDGGGPVGGVAIDPQDGTVYFVAGGSQICRVTRGATNVDVIYAAPRPFGLGDIAVDAQWVYWTEPSDGTILRLPKR